MTLIKHPQNTPIGNLLDSDTPAPNPPLSLEECQQRISELTVQMASADEIDRRLLLDQIYSLERLAKTYISQKELSQEEDVEPNEAQERHRAVMHQILNNYGHLKRVVEHLKMELACILLQGQGMDWDEKMEKDLEKRMSQNYTLIPKSPVTLQTVSVASVWQSARDIANGDDESGSQGKQLH